ncbi:TrkA family potassium uptake protein [Methanomethylovorans sp.]|uniref:potassium channel family protein n=1 Tax=Methanomethylovorans sp. TaxID=2758717 RepID=UPI00351C755D
MYFWRIAVAKYIASVLVIFSLYLSVFIYLMRMEGKFEYANVINGVYWLVCTVTTVGYGDITLSSDAGKLFSILVQLSGIPLVFGLLFTWLLIPWMEKTVRPAIPIKVSEKLNDHIMICGYNKLVETLIEELQEKNVPYIIIEDDDKLVRTLIKRNISCIFGSASEETALKNAHIDTARFLIANKSDEINATIVLTARAMSEVNIIAIVENVSNAKYLKYAGANRVLSPKQLFGDFIGRKAADPFVGRLTGTTEFFEGVSIVEFPIYPKSSLMGKTLRSAAIREKTGANVVGIWNGGKLTYDVSPNERIRVNSVLLAIGTMEQLSRLKRLTQEYQGINNGENI